jgi:hypothetical protein
MPFSPFKEYDDQIAWSNPVAQYARQASFTPHLGPAVARFVGGAFLSSIWLVVCLSFFFLAGANVTALWIFGIPTLLGIVILLLSVNAYAVERNFIIVREHKYLEKVYPPTAAINPAPLIAQPFAPPEFVKFVWDWRAQEGKFPTISQCVAHCHSCTGASRETFNDYYTKMVQAGAIIGRVERGAAGDPAPGWSREQFEEAALRAVGAVVPRGESLDPFSFPSANP